MTDRFATARAVADAVLFEGYLLYPYRASARKNQVRWQFGVLVSPAWAGADPSERSSSRTEVIVDPGSTPRLNVRLRCLQVQRRRSPGAPPWSEAVEQQVDLPPVRLLPLADASVDHPFAFDAHRETEGGVVRERSPVSGVVRVRARWADGPGALLHVSVEVANTTDWFEPGAARDDVVQHALVAVHTLLAVDDGAFVSVLDPPAFAAEAVAGCRSDGTFPVLVGDEGATDVVLSSPIILYDHPAVAPESEGDLFDATEIDEILALRVLTLTDDEKAEARVTDARAAGIVDRIDAMTPDAWAKLHGAIRSLQVKAEAPTVPWWDPGVDASVDPGTDTVWVNGERVGKGSKVVLRPGGRADAHDMFLAGRTATVAGVFLDVDGGEHLAVTVDDDPASDLGEWQGRYRYFRPEEVEVVGG